MALEIPRAGLQLEEDFTDSFDHLPTQAFILDLGDDVIEGMIEAVSQGHEISLSLGNTPTFRYASSSHHIEPTFEDETDDIELFLTRASDSPGRAERLPQLAMSLFRKPELGNPWAHYRTSSSEDEDEEYEEINSSPEPDDAEQRSFEDLNTDIAQLRNSLLQKEAEKIEKSARVIEGGAPAPAGKPNAKRSAAGSLQKALSGRRSPYARASLSPRPASPILSAAGSPYLAPSDASNQAAEKARHTRSPIIHELAFKEQPYDILWQKYPGSSEAEFKSALEKVADLEEETQNYILRKKYWRELDVWNHDYASDEERQQAIDNAIRQYDKLRLSTTEPEWDKLLPKEERGQGKILSKVQATIAKGPAAPAPKIKVQKVDDSSADSGGRDDSGENMSGSNRTDEDGADSEVGRSPSLQALAGAAAKKKITAREAQEKRLLSTKKKTAPTSSASSSVKVSPAKPAARASNEKQSKFKSKEFISESDTSDSESESAPLATTVHQSKLSAANAKPSLPPKAAPAKAIPPKPVPASPVAKERIRKDNDTVAAAPAPRKAKPSPLKEIVKPQITAKPLPKKRVRDYDDDDSSSSSSSGTPLSKRIKPLKPPPKAVASKERERYQHPSQPSQLSQAPLRASNISPNSSSSSGGGGGGSSNPNGAAATSKPKNNNTSPVKSSPLASSPPTNASELDLSSEESVPPIGSSNTSKKRKLVEDRRNNLVAPETSSSTSNKVKKRRHLPEDLVDKALRFKAYYEKYEALYKNIASRVNPPKEKVDELLKMHNRLQDMKNDIHNEAMVRA